MFLYSSRLRCQCGRHRGRAHGSKAHDILWLSQAISTVAADRQAGLVAHPGKEWVSQRMLRTQILPRLT